jgi:two-component system phosphate regulon sensor histidine kinase PhoR
LSGPRLSVKDTGIGIERKHHARVFERFYRVDKSRSKESGGTGLGLSIVRHGASLHGGRVHLESAPGAGTEVSIQF